MTQKAIQVQNLTHTYVTRPDEYIALSSIDFDVTPGEFVVFVGPSGCGKSTLLSLIAGLITPTKGEILLYDEPVLSPSPRVGYMLQKDALLTWRTVEQNILLGLQIRKQATPENIQYAKELLHHTGLTHVSDKYPSQLSGGMRQRVALVRTIALQPDILLLDEPLSSLDIQNKIHLEELLVQLLKDYPMTTLLVTHDLEEAIAVGDRIFILKPKPGLQVIEVPDEIRQLSPLHARQHPDFRSLFAVLWQEVENA